MGGALSQAATLTMTPATALRPGTRIVRQRSPVAMTGQAVKVVGAGMSSQPQIISIGGQGKTIVSGQQAVSCTTCFNVLHKFYI